ncbi:hypothetical protein BD410DRAFT_794753 [Rickenella mellea]|uniref:Uncharacterized protein n=1 Tax=Rickenella mellea TaxID=50990 RepID=A0A4Y7PPK5_9AGAM|nr:hypothetical protein BD410DRAFT_794753 [Rickenella mellea]
MSSNYFPNNILRGISTSKGIPPSRLSSSITSSSPILAQSKTLDPRCLLAASRLWSCEQSCAERLSFVVITPEQLNTSLSFISANFGVGGFFFATRVHVPCIQLDP